MKPETAALLEKFHKSGRFQFIGSELGLELEHDLADEEKMEVVQAEYGTSLTGTVDDLFVAIMKKVVRLTGHKVKKELTEF